MNQFYNSPLSDSEHEIRIVELLPGRKLLSGRNPDPVVCNLRHYGLNTLPPYEVLSYVWGENAIKIPITPNGKVYEVTPNLYSALIYLRNVRFSVQSGFEAESRFIWVDTICIDQPDIEERNEQVQRMRSIYKYALRVIVWLGKDQEPDDDQLSFSPAIWGFETPPPPPRLNRNHLRCF